MDKRRKSRVGVNSLSRSDLPSSPEFGKHFGLIWFVGMEVLAVVSIAGYFHREKISKTVSAKDWSTDLKGLSRKPYWKDTETSNIVKQWEETDSFSQILPTEPVSKARAGTKETDRLTIGSGASSCLHIIQGTPVLRPTAICPAHFVYALP
nr:hypothetical protein Iba_scaffold1393CG0570 [Ipomoea batatas]